MALYLLSRVIGIFCLWYGIDIFGGRISWKFQLERMLPSRDIKVLIIAHVLCKMLTFSGFWELIVAGRKHSFELKFSGHSTHEYICRGQNLRSKYRHSNFGVGHTREKMPITLDRRSKGSYSFGVFHTLLTSTLCTESKFKSGWTIEKVPS